MNTERIPLGTKVVLAILVVMVIAGVFAVLGITGGIVLFIFAAFSVLNKAPRKDINSRGDQGDF